MVDNPTLKNAGALSRESNLKIVHECNIQHQQLSAQLVVLHKHLYLTSHH